MKKPKLTKYPKRPKVNASPEVKERYVERCAEIDKKNKDKMKPYDDYLKAQQKADAKLKKVTTPAEGLGKAGSKRRKR